MVTDGTEVADDSTFSVIVIHIRMYNVDRATNIHGKCGDNGNITAQNEEV